MSHPMRTDTASARNRLVSDRTPPATRSTETSSTAVWGWFAAAAFVLLPILAHGCHGDEDHELFAGRAAAFAGEGRMDRLQGEDSR